MTRVIRVQENAPEDERQNALRLVTLSNILGEDVLLNEIRVDFRHARLTPSHNWQALGLSARFNSDASELWIAWSPAAFKPSDEFEDDKAVKLEGVWLRLGDALSIDEVTVANRNDPVLMEVDRLRASATVVIARADGTRERHFSRMSFVHPHMMESDQGLAVLSHWTLSYRLGELEKAYEIDPSGYDSKAVSALGTAKKLFIKLHSAIAAALEPLAPTAVSLQTLPHIAAAFGYAVGLAEAEFSVRREVRAGRRKRSEGGKARAKQQQALAEEWRAAALEIARDNDRGPGKLTREALAMRILRALEKKSLIAMPSRHSIVLWLQKEAEEPNGPLRSRRRRRGGT